MESLEHRRLLDSSGLFELYGYEDRWLWVMEQEQIGDYAMLESGGGSSAMSMMSGQTVTAQKAVVAGAWNNTATWINGALPSAGDNVRVGDVTLGSSASIQSLQVGWREGLSTTEYDNGKLVLTSSNLAVGGDLFLADGANRTGEVQQTGGSVEVTGKAAFSGGFNFGNATYSISSGGLSIGGDVALGDFTQGPEVSGIDDHSGGAITIGLTGASTLSIGGSLQTNRGYTGRPRALNADAGSTLEIGGNLESAGFFTLNSSGNSHIGGDLQLGRHPTRSNSVVNVSAGTLTVDGAIGMGYTRTGWNGLGQGQLNISGGIVTASDLVFGTPPRGYNDALNKVNISSGGVLRIKAANYSIADALADINALPTHHITNADGTPFTGGVRTVFINGEAYTELGQGGWSTPSVSIVAESANVNEGAETTFAIARTGGDQTTDLEVLLDTPTGAATEGDDYDWLPTSVTIPAGDASASFDVYVWPDAENDPDETVTVAVQDGPDYVPGSPAEATVTIGDRPMVSITAQGEAHEGQSKAVGDIEKLGFWLRRAGDSEALGSPLTVAVEYGGNAQIGSDVWGVPSQIEFSEGQEKIFVPIGMMEDTMPEWTELFQVKISESAAYVVAPDQSDYVSFKVYDDDYFYVGSYEAPDTELNAIVTESSGESHTESIPLEVVGTEFNAVVGLADGDWLPWLTGAETSGGDPVTAFFNGAVDALPTDDAGFLDAGLFSSATITGEAMGTLDAGEVPGDPMLHARNLAILEEHKPGFTFEVTPDGQHYHGTDVAGRFSTFDLNLVELGYRGTHHGWYLKFNDNGSIERWGGKFVDNPTLIGRVRPSDKELLEKIKDRRSEWEAAAEYSEIHRQTIENFNEFAEALKVSLETAVSLLPGATAVDIEQAVTGQDPFKPNVQVSGVDRTMAAASAIPIVGALQRGKKLTEAADRLRENWNAGRKFQTLVTETLGEVENTQKFKVVLRSGKIYKTIPDIVSMTSMTGKAMMEIKRVDGLASLTPQLEAQILAAKELGMKYRLILSPNATADGVAPVIKTFLGQHLPDKSSIVKFNPETRKLEHLWP